MMEPVEHTSVSACVLYICVSVLRYPLDEFILSQTEKGAVGKVRNEVFTAMSRDTLTAPEVQES